MGSYVAATIVAKNYISLARVLANSFLDRHTGIPFFVLLADETDGFFDPAEERFKLIELRDLDVPHPERFRFHYSQQPLSYAATPYLIRHLIDRGFERVLFFKQESLVMGSHSPVFDLLNEHSIVLTPHLLDPLGGDDRITRELNISVSGVYNIGMMGVSSTATSQRFLDWWQDRVYAHCRHDISEGMHYEQRWIDLVPSYFDEVHILRDPGYNVAHWNLPDRAVQIGPEGTSVNGKPARLFRFSGFEPDNPNMATKYSGRLSMHNMGAAAEVFASYLHLLEAAGYQETRRWLYSYSSFDNGVQIPDIARQIYLQAGDTARFGNPFQTAQTNSYYRWLNQSVDHRDSLPISNLWYWVYRRRPDLQRAFPDALGKDRRRFLEWTLNFGVKEHDVCYQFVLARGAV